MAIILKGAPVCEQIKNDLKLRSRKLRLSGIHPKVAIVRIGERGDDISYERNIEKVCSAVDIRTEKIQLPITATQAQLIEVIQRINSDDNLHGLMLFRPLPKHINEHEVCRAIAPIKDIDGVTETSAVSVYIGNGDGFAPCTASACVRLLDYYKIPIAGKHVVIIGRSLVVGKPLAMMLLARDATVTICHTKTIDMPNVCCNADILVAAAGKAKLVKSSFLNDRQVIVDVGFNVDTDGNICGDVDFTEAEAFVSAISPVPAGIGGITARIFAEHVVEAAEKQRLL